MNECSMRAGITKIRAIHMHDCLDGAHDALHHGRHLCVWERLTAYFSRHMTNLRHAMTDSRKTALPHVQWPHDAPITQGDPDRDGQHDGTHEETDERRFGQTLLGARRQYHTGDQHVPQADREGAEDPLRGHRQAGNRVRQREHGKVSTLPIASAAAAPLQLGQLPSQGSILLIGQKYSKYAILSTRSRPSVPTAQRGQASSCQMRSSRKVP